MQRGAVRTTTQLGVRQDHKTMEKQRSVLAKSFDPLLPGSVHVPFRHPLLRKGSSWPALARTMACSKIKQKKKKRVEGEVPTWAASSPFAASGAASAHRRCRVNSEARVTFPSLSITRELFTAGIKHTPRSCKIHCPEVSWNLLSLLPWNKTNLTSVRFAVK